MPSPEHEQIRELAGTAVQGYAETGEEGATLEGLTEQLFPLASSVAGHNDPGARSARVAGGACAVLILRCGRPLAAAAVLVAGCGDGQRSTPRPAPPPDLSRAVLTPADLGPAFRQVDVGPQLRTEQPGGTRADPRRFGRQAGWKARFARQGSPSTTGPLVVEARVDAFADADGARRELAAVRTEGSRAADPPGHVRALPRLGDEALAYGFSQAGVTPVRHVVIAWRHGRLTGTISVNGFRGVDVEVVAAFGRRQQQRMARAARGA